MGVCVGKGIRESSYRVGRASQWANCLGHQCEKKKRKLEANVAELEKSITQLRSIHHGKLEMRDDFYEVEKAKVSKKLQVSYNAKLLRLYA